jgi:hypothetical protein
MPPAGCSQIRTAWNGLCGRKQPTSSHQTLGEPRARLRPVNPQVFAASQPAAKNGPDRIRYNRARSNLIYAPSDAPRIPNLPQLQILQDKLSSRAIPNRLVNQENATAAEDQVTARATTPYLRSNTLGLNKRLNL